MLKCHEVRDYFINSTLDLLPLLRKNPRAIFRRELLPGKLNFPRLEHKEDRLFPIFLSIFQDAVNIGVESEMLHPLVQN